VRCKLPLPYSICKFLKTVAVHNILYLIVSAQSSLSFRTNTHQDLIFRELKSLKRLVEETLKASQNTEPGEDPFAARLSRNMHSLVKSAQQFHSTASSTASTKNESGGRMSNTSTWGGSDYVRLTDPQRERIERWNQQLQVVEEVSEDNITTTEETSTTDHSTVITTPDLAAAFEKPLEQIAEGDQDSDEDDSDIELDFLKNFDELAYTSFARKDYSKSEQFLRKAMERSTGDSSGETDFNLLRIRLAICCCLQDKWEFASGALIPLSKSRSESNLPVFHLLQAIALGYLANNRFEDAHNVCKTALQGKKKILGKASDDFQECLSILALIYEKKGDLLEAEAVRLSISAGWTPSTTDGMWSGKQYILDHKSLIDLAFGKKSADTAVSGRNSASLVDADVPKSGHWTTLTPRQMLMTDGLQRAKKDERTGVPVGNSDTGKEFFSQDRDELIPRRRTETGIWRAINDEYSGKQVGEFDSGKEVATESIDGQWNQPVELPADIPAELPATESKRPKESIVLPSPSTPRPKFEPWWPLPSNCMWKNIQGPPTATNKRSKLAADWYSTLELVSQLSTLETTYKTGSHDIPSPQPTDNYFLQTLPWTFGKAVDIRAPDSIIKNFAIALDRTAVNTTDPRTVSCNIGVCLGLGDASFGMSHGDGSEVLCVSVLLLQHDFNY